MKTNSFKRLFTIYLLVIFGIISTLTSCVQTKQIVYFQGDTTRYISIQAPPPVIKTIQPKDILAVMVNSLSEESNVMFNLPNTAALTYTNFSLNSGMGRAQPAGYLVDSLGYISMPLIGKVNVKGLTLISAADTITRKLNLYLKEPAVTVRILNHKFSVLGEVNRPGVYNLIEDRVSIPEALGMAGDLTIFGKRNNILLIRERVIGKRELVRIDLTSRDILISPYYYIEQNDVLYIEPLKSKATATDQNYQLVPIFTGIISALGILILNVR
ncbi:polysaccharide biosynthesis/export family protein [Flectobacillus sp. DC10W]|uniref:Polysaccharide biosynthesis/export family protein n=1 Tax=Flectobacillus longus TaxID=2984207 RepID=A0ABT6YWC9_9BACT|nr:polysaccharide biosynthesis/export family protein [Flectobacillus longus]MDI9867388.1 polysaccharide biosynthesis/export family protein [Flectobacillus longus]